MRPEPVARRRKLTTQRQIVANYNLELLPKPARNVKPARPMLSALHR